MAMEPLTLVANPGSASRKYSLFDSDQLRASLHVEYDTQHIICTLHTGRKDRLITVSIDELANTAKHIIPIFRENNILDTHETITRIGLRVVAPSGFFLHDHELTQDVLDRLSDLLPRAPLHIQATLHEVTMLRSALGGARIAGISDSAFHATKPDYAWNYGLPLADADRYDIKRFGYHGLSCASAIRALQPSPDKKLIICHLGSGASVTAVRNAQSVDTTMGYSPLEGLIMSTRSGSLDITAAHALKNALGLDDIQLDTYLNNHSGLLGLGGSDDLRILLQDAARGDHIAELTLQTYVYVIQKAIGQMAAVLDGLDVLVFTGTVGERSAPIRERVMQKLGYLGVKMDEQKNLAGLLGTKPTPIHAAHATPVYIAPTDEAGEIARRTSTLLP